MQKRLLCYISFFLVLGTISAQEKDSINTQEKESKYINGESKYNSWSLSAYVGPSSIYTGNLLTEASGFKFGIDGQLGVTKWFNHSFGVEGLFQFGKTKQTKNIPDTEGSTKYFAFSLNGMLNLNSVFRRADLVRERKWNAYVYAGLGAMSFTAETTNSADSNKNTSFKSDEFLRTYFPQAGAILSRRLSNNFDISTRINFLLSGRDKFDGYLATAIGESEERLLSASIGLTYHFGKKEKLVWTDPLDLKISEALKGIQPIAAAQPLGLEDDDNDGVANRFDIEPNTIAGAIVSGAGKALDIDQDGVVDGLDLCPTVKGLIELDGCPKEMNQVELDDLNLQFIGINFDSDKAEIKPEYYRILNKAAYVIKQNSGSRFMISGYTDCVGSMEYNQSLSERRALSVQNYLLGKQVTASQLTTLGQGEDLPINTCGPCSDCSKNQNFENRRIEFSIIK